MALSKKHFERIAREINNEIVNANCILALSAKAEGERDGRLDALTNLTDSLCVFFREENPNFDKSRFLKACGF